MFEASIAFPCPLFHSIKYLSFDSVQLFFFHPLVVQLIFRRVEEAGKKKGSFKIQFFPLDSGEESYSNKSKKMFTELKAIDFTTGHLRNVRDSFISVLYNSTKLNKRKLVQAQY